MRCPYCQKKIEISDIANKQYSENNDLFQTINEIAGYCIKYKQYIYISENIDIII